MNAETGIWLETCLAPIAGHLARPDLTDLWINRPGEIWCELLGGRIERHDIAELTSPLLLRMARQIAALTAQGINREHPILSGALPTGERVQVIIPPATRGDVAIAIRKHAIAGMALEDYRTTGAFAQTGTTRSTDLATDPMPMATDTDPIDQLRTAVRSRQNILISGGTSTGKTTFLNALLREVPEHERLILIEDTPELQMTHANAVGLLSSRSALGEAAVTTEDLLIASLRMRPDRIILGEIRGPEAATFLRAVNTGHPGAISTIHADNPERAIEQLAFLVVQSGAAIPWENIILYVRRSIKYFVHLERKDGKRYIYYTSII